MSQEFDFGSEKWVMKNELRSDSIGVFTVVIGAAFRGPPGLGGDNFGLSNALDSQSFFTGGGTGVPTVANDTSPICVKFQDISICILSAFSFVHFYRKSKIYR